MTKETEVERLIEMVWLSESDETLGTVSGTGDRDVSDAMLRLIGRSERGLQHGDHFETGEYE